MTACSQTDVGAPCSHGNQEPPQQPVVTFPALACNELMCLYAERIEVPTDPCESDADCNASVSEAAFECVDRACRLRGDYVLSRSMCTQRCDSDADCEDGYEGTQCEMGFACARLQELGDFCCEKMCVCRDDLGSTAAIDRACESGQGACCQQDPRPPGCGG